MFSSDSSVLNSDEEAGQTWMFPVSLAQTRLWFLDQLCPGDIPTTCRLSRG